MSITHRNTRGVQSDNSGSISGSWNEVGNSEVSVDRTIGANVTNQQITLAFTVAACQDLFFLADKGATLKTNSTTTPGDTITLKPGIPLTWSASAGYYSNPYTVDVTTIYVTTTTATRFQAKVLTT